jgi:hypothetical protein
VVSSRFEVFDLDLQARARGKVVEAREREAKGDFQKKETEEGTENSGSKNSASPWDSDATLKIPITADGVWNAVVFWFECDMGGGDVLRSAPPPGVKGKSGAQPDAGKQVRSLLYFPNPGTYVCRLSRVITHTRGPKH